MNPTPDQIQAARDDLARFERVPDDGSQREWRPVAAESLRVALAAMGEARDNASAAEELAREADAERKAVEADLALLRASLTVPERYVGVVSEAVAEEMERAQADLAALRIEHALHVDLLAAARREREEARANHTAASTILAGWREKAQNMERDRDELRARLRSLRDVAHRGLTGGASSVDIEEAIEAADAALAGSGS